MTTPTGGFFLVPATLVPDGATATATGTVLMPIPSPGIYLDGSASPTAIGSLPPGWTPDDGYTWHHLTFCATSDDVCAYPLTALAQTVTATGPNSGLPIDDALTGLTMAKLTAFIGSTVTITATIGGGGAQVSVQNLINNDGTWDPDFNISLVGTYTDGALDVTSITPSAGSVAGGQAVTIRGHGFSAATGVVLIGGETATSVLIVNDTTATAVTPAHPSGAVDVAVLGVGTGTGLYTYVIPVVRLPPIPTRTPIKQGDDAPRDRGRRRG